MTIGISMGFVHGILNALQIRDFHPTHINRSASRGLAKSPALLPSPSAFRVVFLIGCEIETDEEQQIAAQYAHARKGGEFLSSAFPGRGEGREVGTAEVGVGGEVDEAEIDDELNDLEDCDPFFPPYANAPGGLEVVPVHYDMDGQVEGDGYPRDRGQSNQLSVAEEGRGAMVVGVEKG